MENINLCTNETILELMREYKSRLKKAERLTVIAISMMLIQTIIFVGGVIYFFSAYSVEVTDEVITQTVEGDNTSINNVNGDNNTITNTSTMGGND